MASKAKSIKEHLQKLVKITSADFAKQIESVLIKNLFLYGWLWTTTLYNFYLEIVNEDLCKNFVELINKPETQEFPLARLHLVQIFAKHINYDHIWEKLSPIESIIALRSLILNEELDVQIAEAFSKIDNIQRQNRACFTYNR